MKTDTIADRECSGTLVDQTNKDAYHSTAVANLSSVSTWLQRLNLFREFGEQVFIFLSTKNIFNFLEIAFWENATKTLE